MLLRYRAWQTELFVTLGHFLPFYPLKTWIIKIVKKRKNTWRYYHFTHVYHKWRSYVRFLRYGADRQTFLSFWANYFPFTPLTTRYSKFWKNEKTSGDDIILHICTININHLLYGSWDKKHNRQNFLSFWAIFCTFTPLTWKIKVLKNWIKRLELLSFYTCVP